MTKLEELYSGIKSTGIPVAYQGFKEAQPPPYIAYFVDEEDGITADGENILTVASVEIHLLTARQREREREKSLEAILKELKIGWHKDLDWDVREKIYDTIYSIELIEGE